MYKVPVTLFDAKLIDEREPKKRFPMQIGYAENAMLNV